LTFIGNALTITREGFFIKSVLRFVNNQMGFLRFLLKRADSLHNLKKSWLDKYCVQRYT